MTEWHPDLPESYRNQIVTGDAKELAERIPDASCDLIFADPIYDRIEDYRWLAETAARVLKPRASTLTFCWIGLLDLTLAAMQSLHLEWVFSLYIPNRTKDTRCKAGFNKWTPCLWHSLGAASSPRTGDLIQCNAFQPLLGNGHSNHEWSKAPEFIAHYVAKFTSPQCTVFDPFCGGGTIPAVCKMLGRNYIAFEISPEVAEKARQRVAMTQEPLPGLIAEQGALELDNVL